MRRTISFNDSWKFKKTSEVPSTFPNSWEAVTLPHTWNNIDGQDGGNDYWRGRAMHDKAFSRPEMEEGDTAVLEFLGAPMTADV